MQDNYRVAVELQDNVYNVALAIANVAWQVHYAISIAPRARGGPYVFRIAPMLWMVIGAKGVRLAGKDWYTERVSAYTLDSRITKNLKTEREIAFFLSRANRLVSTLRRLNQQLAAQRALAIERLSPLAARVVDDLKAPQAEV